MAESSIAAPAGAVGERTSYEEFLEEYAGERAEWIDGWVYPTSPVGAEHQEVVRFLLRLMSDFLEAKPAGRLFFEPFQMKLGPDLPGREPDLFFVANERLDGLRASFFHGPADLAVEVVSPDSKSRDRGDKFYEYERAGVREYWIVDPERRAAEFYQLDDAGTYRAVPLEAGVYRSRELEGFWLRVDWLWERPPLREALAELGVR